MKTQISKLAALMLKQASDSLSNNGCNDLDDETRAILFGLSNIEKAKFMIDADEWNKGPTEIDSPENMPDWMLADVLAYQLEKYFND